MSVRRNWLVLAISASLSCGQAAPPAAEPSRQAEPAARDLGQVVPAHPALGPIVDLAPKVRGAFQRTSMFGALPEPGPDDWLANHRERGQTVEQFRRSNPNMPDGYRRIIYVLPIGTFGEWSPPLETLEAYGEAFFHLEVERLPAVAVDELEVTVRDGELGRQLRAPDILRELGERIPLAAYCLIGVTMEDLYPEESWNFVFGYASLDRRVGVYSLARYDPAFYRRPRSEGARQRMLRRGLKVMAHEIGHMFGIQHCVHYSCAMNGSNHLDEADSKPMHLCPVCLRKLHMSVGFDPTERYRKLARFYHEQGFASEAAWIQRRLGEMEAAGEGR